MAAATATRERPRPNAFLRQQAESGVIPPSPAGEVTLSTLRDVAARCDVSATPERCELLSALFNHGELLPSAAFAP